MLQNTINTQDMQELSILPEYQELKKQYKQLSIKYKVRTAKYKLLKKNFLLASRQIQRWARRYQRLKITVAASNIEIANFETYAASIEENQNVHRDLQALVHKLSEKNQKLEQELELSKTQSSMPQWQISAQQELCPTI